MWIRVVSLRSPTARLFYLFAALVISVLLFTPSTRTRSVTAHAGPIPVYRVATAQRAMSLTINVVWGTQYVPKLLAALTQAHARATFMVGGAWAQVHPDLVRQMIRDGMQVGNHGWAHGHPNQMSLQGNVMDIQKTNDMVKSITGIAPTVYAPPYGEFNSTVLQATHRLGMPLIMWTIDTIDWRPSSSVSYMVDKVLKKSRPGALVLMHPTDRTVEALPQIILGLKQRGYQLVTVSELLKMGTAKSDV